MKLFVYVEGIGKITSMYLDKRELLNIGKEKVCLCCRGVFIIGAEEIKKAMQTEKGKTKTTFEVWVNDECHDIQINSGMITHFGDITKKGKLQKLNVPIDLREYDQSELAVLFGVQALNQHICKACKESNDQIHDPFVYSIQT